MTEADRKQEADRLLYDASMADSEGREEEALALYRRAALLGEDSAQSNLGVMLTNRGGRWRAEGMRWLKRAAYGGNGTAAWNLAMQYRIEENRRGYLRWMRVSARLAHEEAVQAMGEIDRRRSAGAPWSMLKGGHVGAQDVEWMLDDVRIGEATSADAVDWATGVIDRSWAAGVDPADRERLLPMLWEMAASGLTPQRAAELIYKLTA